MDESQIRAGLHQAFAHIKRGERPQAITILKRIIQEKPDEANAWWLLANAVEDPQQRRVALQRAITFDPTHQQARAALAKLTGEMPAMAAPPIAPAPTSRSAPMPEPPPVMGRYATPAAASDVVRRGPAAASDGGGLATVLGVVLIVVAVAVGLGVAYVALVQDGDDDSITEQAVAPAATQREAGPTQTPFPTRPRPTLPPVASETPTVLVTYPTNTPRPTLQLPPTRTPFAGTPRATLNRDAIGTGSGSGGGGVPIATPVPEAALEVPAAVGEDYWYGFDGSMNEFTQGGGYYRFYDFPVKFYQGPVTNNGYQYYIDDAIAQISQVVPIERTDNPAEADLFLEFLPRAELQSFCNAVNASLEGCGALFYDPDVYSQTGRVEYIGFAAIAADTTIPEVVIVHELLHGVGVMVHSNDTRDIMYYRYTEGFVSARMTTRDYNTLRRLYNARAFGEP